MVDGETGCKEQRMLEREKSPMTSFWPDWAGRCAITGLGGHSRILGKNRRFGLEHAVAGGPGGLWLLLEGSTDLPVSTEPSSTRPGPSVLGLCKGTTLSSGLMFHNTLPRSFALAKLICALVPVPGCFLP